MSRSARWMERFAWLLLRLYPAGFRRQHGAAYVEAAAHRLERERSACRGEAVAMLTAMRVLVADALSAAPAEWRRPHRDGRGERRSGAARLGVAIGGFAGDVRLAVRALAKRPGFSALVVGTLALGIGASAAVFGVLDRIILSPLPYPNGDRLVYLALEHRERGWQFAPFDDVIERWRAGAQSIERIETYRDLSGDVREAGGTRVARVLGVSRGLPEMLSIRALTGRIPDGDAGTDGPVLMVSERFWRGEWGSDPGAVGRTVRMNDTIFAVAGVWPEAARLGTGDAPEFVRVLPPGEDSPRGDFTMVLALVKDGVTPGLVENELASLAEGVADIPPSMVPVVKAPWGFLGDDYIRGLWLVFWGGVVLTSVAVLTSTNLMLGRMDARGAEIDMRLALGASRAKLARLIFAESAILCVSGLVTAVAVAATMGMGMRALAPGDLLPPDGTGLAGRALGFAAFLTAGAALVCTFGPLAMVRRRTAAGSLTYGQRAVPRPSRFRAAIVAAQAALAVVLVAGAALLARSLVSITSVDTGMALDRLLIASVRLPGDRYPGESAQVSWQARAAASLRGLPGVRGVTTSSAPPLAFSVRGGVPVLDGEPEPVEAEGQFVAVASAPPEYFEVLGIPILEGRSLRPGEAGVVVVNHSFARMRQGSVVGRTLRFPGDTLAYTVIGVAGDVRSLGLTDSPDRIQLYYPDSPGGSYIRFVLQTEDDPAALMPSVRSTLSRLDPSLPLRQATTGPGLIRDQTARLRFVAALLAVFAGIGIVFAIGAVYGTTAIEAGRRVREVGLRMALGATAGSVLRRVAFAGLVPTAAGAAIGTVAVLWAAPVLDALLFRIRARDPVSISAAIAVLFLAGLVGSALPAWRASRVHPAVVLRAD